MVSFENLKNFSVDISRSKIFQKRFLDEEYVILPEEHLRQITILNNEGAQFLWEYISTTQLHHDVPFKRDIFSVIDKAKIKRDNQSEIKKWLYRRGLPFAKEVYVSWQPQEAVITPWKMVVKYFENFYLGGEDVTVIDSSLNWALLFYHEDEIYFGSNESFVPSEDFKDVNFLWD